MAGPEAADGGGTAMADTAGSGRCSGRSPISTSMTMRCGDRVPAPRSGTMATTTSMPACSGPMTIEGLAGYLPPRGSPAPRPTGWRCCAARTAAKSPACPIDLIAQAIEPTEPQRAALDDLANASVTAAQKIKAACPTTVALTASGRLASMQQRIEAMISGVATVQPALDKFYGLAERRAESAAECRRRGSGKENRAGAATGRWRSPAT